MRQLIFRSASAWRYLVSSTTYRCESQKALLSKSFCLPIFNLPNPQLFVPPPHTTFTYPPISFLFSFSWILVNSKKKLLSAGKRHGCKKDFHLATSACHSNDAGGELRGPDLQTVLYFLLIPLSLPFAILPHISAYVSPYQKWYRGSNSLMPSIQEEPHTPGSRAA